MNKILLTMIMLIIGFLIGFFIPRPSTNLPSPTLTGQVVETNDYTYTTAICNSNNECIDVLVECSQGEVKSLMPTSKLHDLGKDFKDFRNPPKTFCE